ncbi:hypothetical protein HanIR_Chr16g0843131 [Helianthus annuus]|nr:hypothetical protein HanIR_Chr16g0843131 [Helianthus annuus]
MSFVFVFVFCLVRWGRICSNEVIWLVNFKAITTTRDRGLYGFFWRIDGDILTNY